MVVSVVRQPQAQGSLQLRQSHFLFYFFIKWSFVAFTMPFLALQPNCFAFLNFRCGILRPNHDFCFLYRVKLFQRFIKYNIFHTLNLFLCLLWFWMWSFKAHPRYSLCWDAVGFFIWVYILFFFHVDFHLVRCPIHGYPFFKVMFF